MDTCLILPCAGYSSRMRIPLPKELTPVAENMMLIDYSLLAAATAGIEEAYLVVSTDKLRIMSSVLGHSRHGIRLVFVQRLDEDPDSDAGSVVRGCRRANLAAKFDRFLVAAPDYWMPRLEMKLIMEQQLPAALVDDEGRPLMEHIDTPVLNRLRRRLTSTPIDQRREQGLWRKLIKQDMEVAKWETTVCDLGFVDVDTWTDLNKVRAK